MKTIYYYFIILFCCNVLEATLPDIYFEVHEVQLKGMRCCWHLLGYLWISCISQWQEKSIHCHACATSPERFIMTAFLYRAVYLWEFVPESYGILVMWCNYLERNFINISAVNSASFTESNMIKYKLTFRIMYYWFKV